MTDAPQIVSSTGHYSMGSEFSRLEYIENKLHYCVENYFDTAIEYQILLPNDQLVALSVPKGLNEGALFCDL